MQRFSCIIIYCFILFALAAQDTVPPPQADTSESTIVLNNPESALPIQDNTASIEKRSSSTSTLLMQLIIFIVVICVIIYGVLYVIKRSKRFNTGTDPFLKTAAVLPLAPDKTVYAVTLMNKAYLLGSSASSLSLIAEITDKELIDAMNLYADHQQVQPKQDFNTLLHTFFPASKPKTKDEEPLDSFLSKQRERLHKNTAHISDNEVDSK
ncbi:MAG: flagellar biosynthetic protein FliO [Treponema sp.]